jgi:uncharacterized protein
MAELTVNTADVARARADFLGIWGALDAKRPTAWQQYGYKQDLTFKDFLGAYDRNGAGYGAVHRLLDKCWQDLPRIKKPEADKEDAWEKAVKKLLKGVQAWQKLHDFDRRNMIGRFSALVYRVADSKKLYEPLEKGGKLVDIVPLYESQIKVLKWNEDTESEDYGKPEMFQIETSPPSDGNNDARPRAWLKVHPSRVQLLAEGAVNGDFYNGRSLLKAGFNNLVDIEKVSGGGAEGALKNSARTLSFEYDAQSHVGAITSANPDGSTSTKSVKEHHEEQAQALNRNQDASIVMQGGKATTLQTQVSDLSPQFEIAANLFAASVQIPFTILFGQQTGRLASDQDQKDWNARCSSRRDNVLTPMLTELITRLQEAGCIEQGEFEIEWKDPGAPSDEQRLENAKKMADINKTLFDSGRVDEGFTGNEVRKTAGFEEMDGLDDLPDAEAMRKAEADEAAAQAALAGKPQQQAKGAKAAA